MWTEVGIGAGAVAATCGGGVLAAFLKEYYSSRTSSTHTMKTAFSQWLIHWVMWVLGSSRAKRMRRMCASFQDENDAFLMDLVRSQQETAYGKDHGFSSINSVEEYVSSQLLTRYSAYETYVKALERGEKNQMTYDKTSPVKKLSMTSGTSGHAKLLPFSKAQGSVFFMEGITVIYEAMFRLIPKSFNLQKTAKIMFTPTSRRAEGGLSIGPASSSPEDAKSLMCMYAIPAIAYQARREDSALYLYALFALKERDLGTLEGNFAFLVYSLMRTIETKCLQLVEDIRSGRIDVELDIDITLREKLNSLLLPDPIRAEELANHFTDGMENIGCRIWPKLHTILTVTTGAFEVYKNSLLPYFDLSQVTFYSPIYAASEGLLGVNCDPKDSVYTLLPKAMFYEFIPISNAHEEQPHTLRPSELAIGEDYELAITNVSGLHRYRFGDVVRLVRRDATAPVVEFRYRMGQLLDLRGEKTSECAMYDAITTVVSKLGLQLADYTCVPFVSDEQERRTESAAPFYVVFLEVEEEVTIPTSVVVRLLDGALRGTNPIYGTFRERDSIAAPSLHFVERGTFEDLRSVLVKAGGVGQQTKIPRVLRRKRDIDWMHAHALIDN